MTPLEGVSENRRFQVEILRCIYKDCREQHGDQGELFELMYDETINWVTIIYKCSRCHRDFTVKIET
jgi:hypothetical protein